MKVLVIASNEAALSEYMKLFNSCSHLEPYFFLPYRSRQIDFLTKKSWGFSIPKKEQRTKSSFLKRLVNDSSLGVVVQGLLLKRFLANRLKKSLLSKAETLKALILENGIEKVLISNDRSCGIEAAVQYCSLRMNIEVILLSFAYSAEYKSSYKLRKSKIYDAVLLHDEDTIYRDPVLGSKGFYKPYEAAALRELGILSKNPWVLGAGSISKMLVDSEREKQRLVSLGGNPRNYRVCGSESHDILFRQLENQSREKKIISQRYNLKFPQTIVIALPQYWEHSLCDRISHFKHVEGLVGVVSDRDANILLSLHPKMDRKNYLDLERSENIHIATEPLSELLPMCDLFIATYSSTVAWALMCQKKVLLIDHIGLDYSDFYSEFNIPIFYNNAELSKYLDQEMLTKGSTKYSRIHLAKLSPFDGKCTQRIQDEIASSGSL